LVRPPHEFGQAEVPVSGFDDRSSRTIEEATVKRFHHDHHQFETHLADFFAACNFCRLQKASKAPRPSRSPANAGHQNLTIQN